MMLNMGGPNTIQEVRPFLTRLFEDRTFIRIPFGLGSLIPKFRTPRIEEQYRKIGGGSPLKEWTIKQGDKMKKILQEKFPEEEFKIYPAMRYGEPFYINAFDECMKENEGKLNKIILFSQYPQYSCSTGGNSLREAIKYLENYDTTLSTNFQLSLIDRWYYNDLYIQSIAERIQNALDNNFSEKDRENVLIIFSAHSIPVKFMTDGDPYPMEIASTADYVMSKLKRKNPYRVTWQSKVYGQWLAPSTENSLKKFAEKNWKNIVVCPLGFTSDHLETLYELDIELMENHHKKYDKIVRAESLNDSDTFCQALAQIVEEHLKEGAYCDKRLRVRCPNCFCPNDCSKLNRY